MIMGKIQDAFMSTDLKMVELRTQMFHQAIMLPPQGQATIQGQMVLGTRQLPRYLVDDIMEPTTCTLQVPFGRAQRKKKVAQGVALPPNSGAMYGDKPIPPNYARVDVTWMNLDFDEDEIDIPTKEVYRFISSTISMRVLWNKSNIILDMPTPVS
jgi:hypothetical protein